MCIEIKWTIKQVYLSNKRGNGTQENPSNAFFFHSNLIVYYSYYAMVYFKWSEKKKSIDIFKTTIILYNFKHCLEIITYCRF